MGDLLSATASLVDIASVSGNENEIADQVEQRLRGIAALEVTRIEDNVVARTNFAKPFRIVLGGHLDTVPPAGNERSRIDGDRCYGCGSADMKGGLAVLLELAGGLDETNCDVTFVFYACEEVARSRSGLLVIDAKHPDLLSCDAAVLLEPTGAAIEAGCQGVLRVRIDVGGARAHAARPWMGTNAIHRAARVIEQIAKFEERQPVIDGCRFHESMQVVGVTGGVASNVVSDLAQVEVTYRFAPDFSLIQAQAYLENHLSAVIEPHKGDRIEIVDAAPAALPGLDNPLLASLVEKSGIERRAKLGWTDVAFFAERGVPATNFGPGDPELAHRSDEFVTRGDLSAVYEALFLVATTTVFS